VITAVDLIKGIGICAGLDVIEVPGATGYTDTNFSGKAKYALKSLEDKEFVFLHVEATDEMGHEGDLDGKIDAIEKFDKEVVGSILNGLEDFSLLLLPDHPTPVELKRHTSDPVPFLLYDKNYSPDDVGEFNEESVEKGYFGTLDATRLVSILFGSRKSR
jgi:2,3-bisphosphoglycerate-independent phosphoglycerate mutase